MRPEGNHCLEEVKEQVRNFISRECLREEITAHLADSLPLISGEVLDSLATLQLIAFLNRAYGIELADRDVDIAKFDSIDLIANLVTSRKA